MEQVEGVAHIGEEILRGRKTGIFVEAVVIGFIGIRNDQMRSRRGRDPIRQFIGERVAVIEEPTFLDDQTACVRTGTSGHPADGPAPVRPVRISTARLMCSRSDLIGRRRIVDPPVAMADHFVSARYAGFGKIRILLHRAGNTKHADRTENWRKISSTRQAPRRLPYSNTDSTRGDRDTGLGGTPMSLSMPSDIGPHWPALLRRRLQD